MLVLFIASGERWNEGVGIVLCTNPTTLLYENIGLSGFPYIISRVAEEEYFTLVFRLLWYIPPVVGQEATCETRNPDAR